MLKSLTIKHYALIDELSVEFDQGFNIITGETGSGKSIMLDALGLIIGDRADTSIVRTGAKKCIVEGCFVLNHAGVKKRFEALDLDFEEETIVRREVSSNGKSRAFVNDTPVTLAALKTLAGEWVDIHSQHQTLEVQKSKFQMGALDRFGGHEKLIGSYREVFNQFKKHETDLEELRSELSKGLKQQDYFQFQWEELEKANLEKWAEQDVDQEYIELENAGEIKSKLAQALNAIKEDDQSSLDQIKNVARIVESLSEFGDAYSEMANRLNSIAIELDDLGSEFYNRMDGIEENPERMAELDAVRSSIFNLERKHQVEGISELIRVKEELNSNLQSLDHLETAIEEKASILDSTRKELLSVGKKLSEARKKSSVTFSKKLIQLVETLNMNHVQFVFEFRPSEVPTRDGLESVQVLFSANKGQKPAPIHEVASGGELSRIMLAIKALSSHGDDRTTMIFDEIDTGVSGEVANAMGRLMLDLSASQQLISITHLPQIASKGRRHFRVLKEVSDETRTNMLKLSDDERIVEIAQMLSGAKTTQASLDNARELLAQ